MTESTLIPEWLQSLDAPLSEAEPSGPWMRYSEAFRQLEKMRINESDDLPLGEWQRPLVRADWGKTAEACHRFLVEQSRDLHVAAWYCEALTEAQHLQGLDRGLQALLVLVEGQWKTLWPAMDGDEIEARIAPFIWINRTLPVSLRKNLTILEPTLLRQIPIRLDDWLRWPAEDAGSDRSKASIRKHVQPDDRAPLQSLRGLAQQSRDRLEQLEQALDRRLGADAPGFTALKQLLGTIIETAQSLCQEPAPAQRGPEVPMQERTAGLASAPAAGARTKPSNREEALALLQSAVESLQQHDPHSPATLLAARAALWGGMSLQQMAQFEASQGRALGTTLELLGVPMQPQDRS